LELVLLYLIEHHFDVARYKYTINGIKMKENQKIYLK